MQSRKIKTIIDLLEYRVKKNSRHIAFMDNGSKFSYSDLYSKINIIEKELLENKVYPQSIAAILMPSNFQFIATFFSVAKIGAVAFILNVNYGNEEVNRYLKDAQAGIYISHKIKKINGDKYINKRIKDRAVSCNDEVLHQFSSGSSGTPKRVARTHYNILSEVESISCALKLSSRDKILCPVPLFHAYGFSCGMMASLYAGAILVLVNKFNPRSIITMLERENISIFLGVPYMFDMLSRVRISKKIRFGSLRCCLSSGISLSSEIARKFYRRFGVFPRQLYGATEIGVIAINLNENIRDSLDSVGKPIGDVKMRVNSSGEIVVNGPSVGKCYYDGGNHTKPLLRNGYFFTGDLGEIDKHGNIYLRGRKTSFINVAGTKVDPREVEEILKEHPAVKDAVVIGVPDKLRGEIIKAVIVLENNSISLDEIRKYCHARIASFKLPRIIELRNEIPISMLGKVLKGLL